MKDFQIKNLTQSQRQLIVQEITNELFTSSKILQDKYKIYTEEELKNLMYLKNNLNNNLVWVILISSIGLVRKFERENSEFRNMDIDTYMKKITILKKYADEISKYSKIPISIDFPIHPINYAVSFKEAIEQFCKNEEHRELCWKVFSEMTGIKQIRKTTKVIQFMQLNGLEERFLCQQSYYHYTTAIQE